MGAYHITIFMSYCISIILDMSCDLYTFCLYFIAKYCDFCFFHVRYQRGNHRLPNTNVSHKCRYAFVTKKRRCNVSEYTDLSDALKKLITYARGEVSNPRLLKGYLCIFLNFLLEQLTLHPNTAEQPELCQKIAEYLNAHFTENISLSSLP